MAKGMMEKLCCLITLLFFYSTAALATEKVERINISVPVAHEVHTIERGAYSSQSAFPKGELRLLENQAAFDEFYSALMSHKLPPAKAPPINFSNQILLAVVDKSRSTGGYAVSIKSIKRIEKEIYELTIDYTSPKKGTMRTMALTKPFHIIALDIKQ